MIKYQHTIIGDLIAQTIRKNLPLLEVSVTVFYNITLNKCGVVPKFSINDYGPDEGDRDSPDDIWYFKEGRPENITFGEVFQFCQKDWFDWTSKMLEFRLKKTVIYDASVGYVSYAGNDMTILGTTFANAMDNGRIDFVIPVEELEWINPV